MADRAADASAVRRVIEDLCAVGMYVAVVSGTHVGNVDGQLRARPASAGLVLALNRGSEVFEVDADGPRLVWRREPTTIEDRALTQAAELVVARLGERGLSTEIVSQRLNRRKVDLIPLPEWADPPKARIGELLAAVERRLLEAGIAGLPEVVAVAEEAAREAGIPDPRVTSDAKHVEIGLTDKSDSARWLIADLWRHGIGPGLVLIGGDEFGPLGGIGGSDSLMLVAPRLTPVTVGVEPEGVPAGVISRGGGPAAFLGLLREQLRRRRDRELPDVEEQSGWAVSVEGFDPEHERVHEAWLTLADGRLGTSGAPGAPHAAAAPRLFVAGVYDGEGPDTRLAAGPVWDRLVEDHSSQLAGRRVLDLHSGVLEEVLETDAGRWKSVRFSSLARPGIVALRAERRRGTAAWAHPLAPPVGADLQPVTVDGRACMQVQASSGGIAAAGCQQDLSGSDSPARLDRLVSYLGDASEPRAALRHLHESERVGFERLLVEHRAAWASRWEDADVVIEGDEPLQRAVRFALFHLMASVTDDGEAAVGARGLSGPAYRGHVFWDADAFVLPFLAATHPESARAMLQYRLRRLPAARAAARGQGRAGARFPWESARTGEDVTPPSGRDRAGHVVPIRTGQLEEHIVADVAWAGCTYVDWSGDHDFAAGPGAELLTETARYWASRIRVESDGSAHIRGVIGPDEYHEPVDDNAFTNVMARWNLRRAARDPSVRSRVETGECDQWLVLAEALVDGYDPDDGVYEQFDGFRSLEPLIIEEVAPRRPIAADLLLGPERVRRAQIVKQPDVLMLHHLVPDEVEAGSLEPNLRYYEPRTAHGSSLSPGVHAALFASAGDFDHALEALRLAARIDLDDLTATTAGGLHLAAMGSVWQALAFGFAGLRPAADALAVAPRLPAAWSALEVRVRFRGPRVSLRQERDRLRMTADRPTVIALDGVRHRLGPGALEFSRIGHTWRVKQ